MNSKPIEIEPGHFLPVLSLEEISNKIATELVPRVGASFNSVQYVVAIANPACDIFKPPEMDGRVAPIGVYEFDSIKTHQAELFGTDKIPKEVIKFEGLAKLIVSHDNVFIASHSVITNKDLHCAYLRTLRYSGVEPNCVWSTEKLVALMNIDFRNIRRFAKKDMNGNIDLVSHPVLLRPLSMIVIRPSRIGAL